MVVVVEEWQFSFDIDRGRLARLRAVGEWDCLFLRSDSHGDPSSPTRSAASGPGIGVF